IEAFQEATGLWIADGYGQTETGAVAGVRPGDEARPGSMGRPLPGLETRQGAPAEGAPGVGELQLRRESCPTFFLRYLDGKDVGEEWWATGDLVAADGDGYLTYVGRSDDLIVSSGYRIGPFEVE